MSCTYRFINSSLSQLPAQRDFNIILRQQPNQAKMSVPNERDRRSIEPPPILQVQWLNCTPEHQKQSLQSPFYFMMVNLLPAEHPDITCPLPTQEYLSGTIVSSLHRLRDVDNVDGGFFIFGDLAVKKPGHFRLHFSLFEIIDGIVGNCKNKLSEPFIVYTPKMYPGPIKSTFLSRTFSDQGIKIRVRKDTQVQTTSQQKRSSTIRKRKHTSQHNAPIMKKEILSLPSYASDHPAAHFGRWQSWHPIISRKDTPQALTPSHLSPISSPTLSHQSSSSTHSLPPMTSPSLPSLMHSVPFEHYRLPPPREIINNRHSNDIYHTYTSPFPLDSSFFK
ncbi:velvet factor-domain-containing protein [Gilbertella persicaria]|uniref:velvet factor-domain-containing protein n=1 Tax=Gilbertella persicaria TaxID=101096 RepID=UPI00221EA47B|nr:velvet factor-domain-containing protein [Gilbertella persicaria]KAI8058658.1 velvet factor-domain-containing protein [Gilbertella persicaria]